MTGVLRAGITEWTMSARSTPTRRVKMLEEEEVMPPPNKHYECYYCGRDTWLYDGYVTVYTDKFVYMHPQCYLYWKKEQNKPSPIDEE